MIGILAQVKDGRYEELWLVTRWTPKTVYLSPRPGIEVRFNRTTGLRRGCSIRPCRISDICNFNTVLNQLRKNNNFKDINSSEWQKEFNSDNIASTLRKLCSNIIYL